MSEPKYKFTRPRNCGFSTEDGDCLGCGQPVRTHLRNGTCGAEADAEMRRIAEAATSPPKDPRDEDVQEIKRLQAAWNSAFNQAMENGAKYQQAMNVLRVAREALEQIDGNFFPDYRHIAREALRQIKELMGEK